MTKSELMEIVNTLKNNILLSMYYINLSNEDELPFKKEFLDKYNLNKSDLSIILNDKKYCKHQTFQLLKIVIKSCVTDLFEVIMDYCDSTKQKDRFKNQSFYNYLESIRHCFSHNYRFEFRDKTLKKLPFSWNGYEINKSLNGENFDFSIFPPNMFMELFNEIVTFVEKDLK